MTDRRAGDLDQRQAATRHVVADSGREHERQAEPSRHQRLDDVDAAHFGRAGEACQREVPRRQGVLQHRARARPLFAHQHMLGQQVLERARAPGECMTWRAYGHQPFGAERVPRVGALVEEPFHERAVDDAFVQGAQQLFGAAGAKAYLHFGMCAQVRGQRGRHHVLACRQRHADGQRKRRRAFARGHAFTQEPVVVRHGGQRAPHQLACRRETQLAVGIGEQLCPVLLLQKGDVLRHGRLRDVEFFGGPRVVQRAAHGQERLDAVVLHGCSCVSDEPNDRASRGMLLARGRAAST